MRGLHMLQCMQFLTPFLSGETVPASGQYWVIQLKHRSPYRARMMEGEHFPVCNECLILVVYEYASDLVNGGVDLSQDMDFGFPKRGAWTL
jgi:hypothetical protein